MKLQSRFYLAVALASTAFFIFGEALLAEPVRVVREGDGVRVELNTEAGKFYGLEVSSDLQSWRATDSFDGSGALAARSLQPTEGEPLFVRFVIEERGQLRGPVTLGLGEEDGFSQDAATLGALLAEEGIGDTDALFTRLGSVYQINREVARLQSKGVPVSAPQLLGLLREAELRTNLRPLENQGFRKALTDRLVERQTGLAELHDLLSPLLPRMVPVDPSVGGFVMLGEVLDEPTDRELDDYFLHLKNQLVERGPIDFSFEEFLDLRDHVAALVPLRGEAAQEAILKTNAGTGHPAGAPTPLEQMQRLEPLPPPTQAHMPEMLREQLRLRFLYPDLPLRILGFRLDPFGVPAPIPPLPPATLDREDGYRHFMVNRTGLAWFSVTIGSAGTVLRVEDPRGQMVVEKTFGSPGNYGFVLPILDEDVRAYWRVEKASGISALFLMDVQEPRNLIGDEDWIEVAAWPLRPALRDLRRTGGWLRFRTIDTSATTGEVAVGKWIASLAETDEAASGTYSWQVVTRSDGSWQSDFVTGPDVLQDIPLPFLTGTHDLWILPAPDGQPLWTLDASGRLLQSGVFPVDSAYSGAPPMVDFAIEKTFLRTRPFVLGLIETIGFSRDGESEGETGEIEITFNANIAPPFENATGFGAIVGDPDKLATLRAWHAAEGSASRARSEIGREVFDDGLAKIRADSPFRSYVAQQYIGWTPWKIRTHIISVDDRLMGHYSVYAARELGRDWYRAIDDAEELYGSWSDMVVQINSFKFPRNQYYDISDSVFAGLGPSGPIYDRRHPVVPTNVPVFAVPKDRMVTAAMPITADYMGLEIDELNGWALVGAALKGAVNIGLAVFNSNWFNAACAGVDMIADFHKTFEAARDDPIGAANFELSRVSSRHGFYGLNDDEWASFDFSGYPKKNRQHSFANAINMAQLVCSLGSAVTEVGSILTAPARIGNAFARAQELIATGDIAGVRAAIDDLKEFFSDDPDRLASISAFEAQLASGILDGDTFAQAHGLYELGEEVTAGTDLFDTFAMARATLEDMTGAGGLGYNLRKSEIHFHFGDYSNRKTTARASVGIVRSVPARRVEVRLDEVKILDDIVTGSEFWQVFAPPVFLVSRVGIVADQAPVGGPATEEVPLQFRDRNGNFILDNGGGSYSTLPNLPFTAMAVRDWPRQQLGYDVANGRVYTPNPGSDALFTATWSDDVNTAAIYVELGAYDDNGSKMNNRMIGVYSHTFLLEDLIKDPTSQWSQVEPGVWELRVEDYPVYNAHNLETLVQVTPGQTRDRQNLHNQQRLMRPSAMVSLRLRLELADFVHWEDPHDYDARGYFADPGSLDGIRPTLAALDDETPIKEVLDRRGDRVLALADNAGAHSLAVWAVNPAAGADALSLLAQLPEPEMPASIQEIFTPQRFLWAQLAREGDFVVVTHTLGVMVFDLRIPADIRESALSFSEAAYLSRMALDADGETIYLAFRSSNSPLAAYRLDEAGNFHHLATRNSTLHPIAGLVAPPLPHPRPIAGARAGPRGGVVVHYVEGIRLNARTDGFDFLEDADVLGDIKRFRKKTGLQFFTLEEGETPAFRLVSSVSLEGGVLTDFILRAARRLQSSVFRIYDEETLLGGTFVVGINSQGSLLDPSISNNLTTKDSLWGIKDLFEKPLAGRRIGPHQVAATYVPHELGIRARSLFRAADPVTPFHVWTQDAMAFSEDPIYVGRRDILPFGDPDNRYAVVRGVGPDAFDFPQIPSSVEILKSQLRGHVLHADRLAQGAQRLMLVDLWGEDTGQTGQAQIAGDTDFGEVQVGKWERRTLTVTNTGQGLLSVRAVEVPPGYRPQWRAALIAPGSSRELVVHFNPREVGLFEGDIVLHTNGLNPVVSIYAAGWGVPAEAAHGHLIVVQGGSLPARDELGELHVDTFELGQFEVTWRLWKEVRAWAVSRGYDLRDVGAGCRDNHPVHSVSWYDVVKWCNARSEREGLQPVYEIDGEVFRRGNFEWQPSGHVTRNVFANGYRLPTEVEWAYAARGGQSSMNYTYSGGHNPDTVAWHADNSEGARCGLYQGKGTWPVGRKRANELGFHDMSGNVDEWLDDHLDFDEWMEFMDRRARGGSWIFRAPAHALTERGQVKSAHSGDFLTGFRVARNDPAAVLRVLTWEGDLDFGLVPVGFSATRNLILRNTGEVPLVVTRLRYPAGYSGDWTGGFIEPGGFRLVTVTFAPTEARTYGGLIRAETSATAGSFTHPVDGEGIGAPEPEFTTLITGGSLPGISHLGPIEVEDFHIGTWEVTWGEWKAVREWAANHGYDLADAGDGCADDHPVHSVSWYDAVKWCNAFSEMEGRTPAYTVGGEVYRSGEFGWDGSGGIHWNTAANGYRLPTAAEWEFAARGGTLSQGYTYSGSDHLNLVAWHWNNASGAFCDFFMGRGTWPVGMKEPNELGLFDMTGNVAEWVWDADILWGDILRWSYGGTWSTVVPEGLALATTGAGGQYPDADSAADFQGLRVARGAGTDAPGALTLSGPEPFGQVGVGATVSRTLTLTNTGSVPVVVANWLFSADFWLGGAVETIAPGQSVDVEILFVPTEMGVLDTWGYLHTNAGVHWIPLLGEGVALTDPPFAPFAIEPQDGATFVDGERVPTLRWSASMSLDRPRLYDYLYFHTDLSAVESRHPMALVAGDGVAPIGDEWTAPVPLQPGTTYYWRVVNGNAGGETVGDVWSFTTLSPVTSYPYFEGFDDKGFEPPAGWSNQWSFDLSGVGLEPGMGYGWGPAYDDDLILEGKGAYTANSWTMPAYYWLVSPPFALPVSGATLRFHVYYQWTPEEPTELFLRVLVEGVWQPWIVWADAAHTNLYADEVVLDLAAFAGQQVRFAFIYNAGAWGSPVAVDAFYIEDH